MAVKNVARMKPTGKEFFVSETAEAVTTTSFYGGLFLGLPGALYGIALFNCIWNLFPKRFL